MYQLGPYRLYEYGASSQLLRISREFVRALKKFGDSALPIEQYSTTAEVPIGKDTVTIEYRLVLAQASDDIAWSIKGQMGLDKQGNKVILIKLIVNKELMPQILSKLVTQIKGILNHETEHIHQFIGRRGLNKLPPTSIRGWQEYHERSAEDYLTDPREIDAYLAQSLRVAKTHKITMKQAMLYELDQIFTEKQKQAKKRVLKAWIKAGLKRYPNADWSDI